MLRNVIGPVFLKTLEIVCFLLFFACFFKNPLLSAGRMRFSKKNGPVFNFKKGKHWTSFYLYSIYIYIYTYAVK